MSCFPLSFSQAEDVLSMMKANDFPVDDAVLHEAFLFSSLGESSNYAGIFQQATFDYQRLSFWAF
jgi:hypothetical protein